MNPLYITLIGLSISVLSFLVGGGTFGKYIARVHRTAFIEELKTDLSKVFAPSSIIAEMARHREEVTTFQARLHEKTVETVQQLARTVEQHGRLLEKQAEAQIEQARTQALTLAEIKHIATDHTALSDEVRALRDRVLRSV